MIALARWQTERKDLRKRSQALKQFVVRTASWPLHSIAAAHEVGRRRRSPHERDLVGRPYFRALWAIVVPWPRIEVAELLILHLVELGVEFDHPVVVIAMERRDVVARSESHRSPDDREFPFPDQVARSLQVREIPQLERDVVHLDALAADEIHRVMVGIA